MEPKVTNKEDFDREKVLGELYQDLHITVSFRLSKGWYLVSHDEQISPSFSSLEVLEDWSLLNEDELRGGYIHGFL